VTVPTITDINSPCQTLATDLYTGVAGNLPVFVSFTDASKTSISFNPTLNSQIASFTMTLSISDSICTQT